MSIKLTQMKQCKSETLLTNQSRNTHLLNTAHSEESSRAVSCAFTVKELDGYYCENHKGLYYEADGGI